MEFEIIDGAQKSPYFGVIYGAGGTGKSWLASYADDPLFLSVEPGTNLIPAKKFKIRPTSIDQFFEMLKAAIKAKPGTLIIDSLGFLEPMIYADVLEKNPVSDGKNPKPVLSIADYGFGRGYAKAMDYWHRLMKGIDAMNDRGINVIAITHSHYKNIPTEDGETYKVTDMALQSFGDYNVPELLKRRADWVLYVESKTKTRSVKNKFGGEKVIPFGAEPNLLVHTRSTSQFFAKMRAADMDKVKDYYELDQRNPDTYRKLFEDIT